MPKRALICVDELDDFCSAILADNRPRSGEPYDTIRKWLLIAREQGGAVERRVALMKTEPSHV